jgi:secretion/DNA translocation related TadE-like protein
LLVCAVAGLVATTATVGVARHTLAAAADEAALAAANELSAGPVAACRQARVVAAASGVVLDRCTVDADGLAVTVSVTRRVGGLLAAAGVLRVRARAGAAPAHRRG